MAEIVEPWADAQDVVDAWIGPDAPSNAEQIDLWISRASRLIRYHVPTIQQRIDDDLTGDLAETVKDIVVTMVTRVYRNPEGIRQVNSTTGPFTDSRTFGGDTPGGLYLSDEELARLNGSVADTRAYTVSMIPADSYYANRRQTDTWVSTTDVG